MTQRALFLFDPLILKRMGFGVKSQPELLSSMAQRQWPVPHSARPANFQFRARLNGECLEGGAWRKETRAGLSADSQLATASGPVPPR